MKKIIFSLALSLVIFSPVMASEELAVPQPQITVEELRTQLIALLIELINRLNEQLANVNVEQQIINEPQVGSSEIQNMDTITIEIGAKKCTSDDIIYPLEITGGEYGYVLREAEVTHEDGTKSGYNAEAINPFNKIVPPPFEGLKAGDVVDYTITVKSSEKGDVLATKEGQLTIEGCE